MFAPPPVQLTRAEIERRKQRQSARADAAAARSSIGSNPEPRTPSSSLHRCESNTSKDVGSTSSGRRGGWFSRRSEKEKSVTSLPVAAVQQQPPSPPPEPPKQHPGDRAASKASNDRAKPKTLSEAFGENPRKAPSPPKRPARPASDVLALPGAFPTAPLPATPPPQRPVPLAPITGEVPPPVPDKSPKRLGGARQNRSVDLGKPILKGAVREEVLARDGELRLQSVRTSPSSRRESKMSPTKGNTSVNKSDRRRSGSHHGKFERSPTAGRRASAAAYISAAMSDMERMGILGPQMHSRRATDGELQALSGSTQPSAEEMSWKRRQAGETMSMLLNDGFFPAQEYMYSKKTPNISVQVPFPPPLSLLNKDLPDTPNSIVPTPTELYHSSPVKSPRPAVKQRKAGTKRRSPLAPLSRTAAKSNSARLPPSGLEHDLSPSTLSIIPEGSTISENTPPGSASGVSTPVATRIHLRGGSVITLSPPELTAWDPTYYLQGAIKLPKPTILPRRGSTASMEAFQDVVDQVYQEALNIPRRKSDDQIVDDICEFFDDFGFETVGFSGGVLGALEVKVDEREGILEEIDEMSAEIERFATPPHEMGATPVERVIAKEVVEHTILLPPVETEETLRARGIARLSQGGPPSPTTSSRRASATTRKDSTVLPLLPVPETTMLDLRSTPLLASAGKSREDVRMKDRPAITAGMDQEGFEWDDVEELDGLSSWVAPAAAGWKKEMSKNPVKRMRRYVATASAIL